MDKILKIVAGVMGAIAVLGAIFLLTAKKPSNATSNSNNQQQVLKPLPRKNSVPAQQASNKVSNNQTPAAQTKSDTHASDKIEWQQCKNRTLSTNEELFWNINITEQIPTGGTYAKGYIGNDPAYLVHVIIKNSIQNPEQITNRLILGKTVLIRGNCIDIANDGAVVLQAY